ncbi:hypothetical protein B5180_37910, partial [Streptomyces sp. BF-3]
PEPGPDGGEPFAGPRSAWGARIARAVHSAVLAGARPAAGEGPAHPDGVPDPGGVRATVTGCRSIASDS